MLDYDSDRESYQLHPLVQEKAYRLLCQNPETFRTIHRQTYRYFLSLPLKLETQWNDIEDIKPLLLAHYHACRAEDWDEAAAVISGVYEFLRRLGYEVQKLKADFRRIRDEQRWEPLDQKRC